MEEVKFKLIEDQPSWIDHLRRWLPRLAVGGLFFFVGKSKFGAQSSWIKTFEQIGFGQWLRYVTGGIQIASAIMILIPRIFVWGILMLAATMLGAIAAWLFLLGNPFNAIFPGALLLGLLVIGGEDLLNLVARRKSRDLG